MVVALLEGGAATDVSGPIGPVRGEKTNPAAAPRATARRHAQTLSRVAWVVFALQFLGMAWWSEVLWSRFSLTTDAANYLQQFFLVSHGHLNAFGTIQFQPAISDHFSLAIWPLSFFDLVWPHGLNFLWLQDAGLVAAEAVAFAWMRRIVRTHVPMVPPRRALVVLSCGLAVLVLNPWTYWSMSFDIHMEPLALPFIVAAAYDFSGHRTARAWVWIGLLLLFGDVAGTWVVGLGLSALAAAYFDRGRHHVRTAALLAAVGVGWLALIGALGDNASSLLAGLYGYVIGPAGAPPTAHITVGAIIKGMLQHPQRALGVLWSHRANMVANLAPAGIVGIFCPWTIGVPLVVLAVNNSTGSFGNDVFSIPGFQSAPIYIFGAVGVVSLFCWLATRPIWARRWVFRSAAALLVANAAAWGIIWIPQVGAAWLRVSPAGAALLTRISDQIAPSDEVVGSQGIIGRFAARSDVVSLQFAGRVRVSGRVVWFIFDSSSGIESEPVNDTLASVDEAAGRLHATLMDHGGGIWAFRWERPGDVSSVTFPRHPVTIPAWTVKGDAGVTSVGGPARNWNVGADGHRGYVVARDYWVRPRGQYEARVTVSDVHGLRLQVWNDNGNVLLAQRYLPAVKGRETYNVPVVVSETHPGTHLYSGVGPFQLDPIAVAPGQLLEIRLWSPAGGTGKAYSLSMLPR
jgi:hypothetical protein